MKKFILWALCCIVFNLAQAQQNYKKAYKKAYIFTHSNADSAMTWAEKSVNLAKNNQEKYEAHYLRGFNAKKLGMYGQALYDYTQARTFTTDSAIYFRVNNNLANTFLSIGNVAKAIKLNEQSIEYSIRNKEWVNLSYAYEIKSTILHHQKDKTALPVLRKALELRKRHAPKQVGFAYVDMAKAFASFEKLDSAVKYQRLALEHYPIRTSNKIATLHTQLAKYLIQNNQTDEALAHLRKAKPLKKIPMTEFFWNHTFGLYFIHTNAHTEARKVFARCEALYTRMLANANDIVSRRTINECGKELYHDFRQLKSLTTTEQELYGTKLQLVEISLVNDEGKIQRRDESEAQRRQLLEFKKPDSLAKTNIPKPQKKEVPKIKEKIQHDSPFYWLLLGLGMAAMATWAIVKTWRKPRIIEKEVPKIIEKEVEKEVIKVVEKKLPPSQQRSVTETILLEKLGFDLRKKPDEEDLFEGTLTDKKDVVLKYYRGMSYKRIGRQINKSAGFVKIHCDNLVEGTAYSTFSDFIKAFIEEHKEE